MTDETAQARECNDAAIIRGSAQGEAADAQGRYVISCIGADGRIKWSETINNVVCTVGKNVMLDAALAGAAYTVVGPYMGLISSTSYTAVAVGDTMTSHAGWLEAAAPMRRPTPATARPLPGRRRPLAARRCRRRWSMPSHRPARSRARS